MLLLVHTARSLILLLNLIDFLVLLLAERQELPRLIIVDQVHVLDLPLQELLDLHLLTLLNLQLVRSSIE